MSQHSIDENWKTFSKLINQSYDHGQSDLQGLVQHYLQQNAATLNEILALSIENIEKLSSLTSTNDILCLQAKFTHQVTTQLTLSSQRFLHMSLGNETDYNEWLKSHCDLATD